MNGLPDRLDHLDHEAGTDQEDNVVPSGPSVLVGLEDRKEPNMTLNQGGRKETQDFLGLRVDSGLFLFSLLPHQSSTSEVS